MGVSTNAILLYGYCWDEEVELFESQSEWPQHLLKNRGEKNPWDAYPKEIETMPYQQSRAAGARWCEDHRAELDRWHEMQRAVEAEFGVELGTHCSGEYSMPYLAACQFLARCGHPVAVPALQVGADWDARLERWLAEFGLAKPEGQDRPQWWLVSYWG